MKKNRVLSREALFKILKAHQDKSSAEPFTFKRFQKQFQQFWDIRVRTMTKQDQLILSKLQNEEGNLVISLQCMSMLNLLCRQVTKQSKWIKFRSC